MDVRRVLGSPPAVAGLLVLALVVGTIFAYRATMGDGDGTNVAGTVIERTNEPSEFVPTPQDDPGEPLIVRPRRDREVAQEPAPDEAAPPAPAPVAPVDPPPVGLVRDPDSVVVEPEDQTPPRRDRDPDPQPAPDRQPAPDPRPPRDPDPNPEPQPQPEPEPEPDTARYELREGTGLTRDSADSYQLDESTWDWTFRSFAGHDHGSDQAQRSRKTQARLSVGFADMTRNSSEQKRTFRCDALLTAGSQRLITDDQHVFEIGLWTTQDGFSPHQPVGRPVIIRQAWDMQAGTSRRLLSNTYQLDAADNVDYICHAVYRAR